MSLKYADELKQDLSFLAEIDLNCNEKYSKILDVSEFCKISIEFILQEENKKKLLSAASK